MKHRFSLTFIVVHFTFLLSAQNYLFPVKTSGYHLAPSYSHLNNGDGRSNLWALTGGYTFRGRFTGSLTIGREITKYTVQNNNVKLNTYLGALGFNYLVLKQEQHHTILSFSIDAGYQFNRLIYGSPGDNASIHSFLYGLSVYRNFHFANLFSISPSFGLGRGHSHYRHDPSPLGIREESYSFPYYNYQLAFKLGNFYLRPTIQVTNGNSYLNLMAGWMVTLL
ncbi:MAG TPA: hypothetical protein PKM27_01245 [Saprospiraceae bacterium]|nr:hypothetical protein [Saprospiraceae bacterium]HNT19170.1 hypothetical protein [Saprospiraceae bacterium]